MNIHSYEKRKGLPFEVLEKPLEIIYFSIFTSQFISLLIISEIIIRWFIRLINAPVGLFKFPLGRGIIELTYKMEEFQRYKVYNTKTHSKILSCNQGHLGHCIWCAPIDCNGHSRLLYADCLRTLFYKLHRGNASLINSEDLPN